MSNQENFIAKEERIAVLTTNPKLIYNNYTLIHNQNVLDAYEVYNKFKNNGSNPSNAYVKARIKTLYYHIRQDIKKNVTKEKFEIIEGKINSDFFDTMIDVWLNDICEYLAKIGIIATANQRDYDTQDAIAEDDAKGM